MIKSVSTRNILMCALAVGVAFSATTADAKKRHGSWTERNTVGVWQCDVEYNALLGGGHFDATLMFGADGNVSIVASNDDDGLVGDPAYAAVTSMKTPALGRWKPKGHKNVAMSAIYYETNGLATEALAGTPRSITKLRCDVDPGKHTLNGECYADVDPADGSPGYTLFPDSPVFTADCERLKVD